jgi:predicted aminopeptidase
VSEEKIFKKSTNQKQESPVAAMFVTDRDRMRNLYRGPSTDASYHVSDHLAKRFRGKYF